MSQLQILLTALKQIRDNGPTSRDSGLCINVDSALRNVDTADHEDVASRMRTIFRQWPEFSGDHYFPVNHPDFDDAGDAYYIYSKQLWEGEYGDARKRLLQFTIDHIETSQQ